MAGVGLALVCIAADGCGEGAGCFAGGGGGVFFPQLSAASIPVVEVVVVVVRVPEVEVRVAESGALQLRLVVGADGVPVGLRPLLHLNPDVPVQAQIERRGARLTCHSP